MIRAACYRRMMWVDFEAFGAVVHDGRSECLLTEVRLSCDYSEW